MIDSYYRVRRWVHVQVAGACPETDVLIPPVVTVFAVGNTFEPDVQGTNLSGAYVIASVPCSTSPCDVTDGGGPNFRVASGTLRLAE